MRGYDNVHPMVNLPDAPKFSPPSWSLERRLSWTRASNPGTTTGAGARRRSRHEHELDELLALARACTQPGALVSIARRSNGGPVVRPGGGVKRGRGGALMATVEPYRLLHEPVEGEARALRGFRAAAVLLLDWLAAHGPASGWAEAQSAPRAAREADATAWYLPRANWAAFYAYREAGRLLAAILLTLHEWWDSLIPTPRFRSEARGRGAEARTRASEAPETRTRCRDQSAHGWEAVARRIGLYVVGSGPGEPEPAR